jgi:hypothetical protein
MESKIALYNADGAQIGETFLRRARQLVKQQRATWMDDNHTAVRFHPDPADDFETAEEASPYPSSEKSPERDHLYALAKIRLRDRRRVIIHLLMFIPAFIAIIFFSIIIDSGFGEGAAFLFFGFFSGVLLTFNVCNVYSYYKQHIKDKVYTTGAIGYWKNRRAIQLAAEVERLKRMGYGE